MGKGWYIGDEIGKARKVKKIYIGDNNFKARKVKKIYVGDESGKARLCWSGGIKRLVCFGSFGYSGYSTDLLSWVEHTPDSQTRRVGTFGNDKFLKSGSSGYYAWSIDGVYWNAYEFYSYPYALEFIDGKFIIYSNGNRTSTGSSGSFYTSLDGLTWEEHKYSFNSNYVIGVTPQRVIKVKGIYIMGSVNGCIWSSSDGTNWTLRTIPNTSISNHCVDIAYGNGRFVVVGQSGCVWYSLNGFDWTQVLPFGYTSSDKNFTSVCFGNGVFVAFTIDSKMYYSTDGVSWNWSVTLLTGYGINQIVFSGEKFYCVGRGGSSYYSIDGISWTKMQGLKTNTTSDNYSALIYSEDGGGRVYS